MGFLTNWFSSLLELFRQVTGNYGVAIILLTLTYKVLLLPLTIAQRKSLNVMKELAPLQQQIQEKYKDNPQEASKKLTELYKEHNANPLGGCLLSLLQLPIGFILIGVMRSIDLEGTSFLWIKELTKPDIILALLTGVVAYFQMSLDTTNTSTGKTNAYIFPAIITFMGINFPAGFSLYILMVYIISYIEVIVINSYLNKKKASVQGGAKK